jgi:hypothetical protein
MTSLKIFQNGIRNKPSLLQTPEIVYNYRSLSLSHTVDGIETKQMFDNIIKSEDYSSVFTLQREFSQSYDFAFIGMGNMEYDLEKNPLNSITSLEKERMKPIFFSALPVGGKHIVLISYFTEDFNFLSKYIQQISGLSHDKFKNFINNIATICTENLIISNRLYDKWVNTEIRNETMMQAYETRFHKFMNNIKGEANFLKTTKYDLFIRFDN